MTTALRQKDTTRPGFDRRVWMLAATLVVLALAWVGGAYGRTDMDDIYGSDGTSYMDIARAIGHGDHITALNPLWSQGYPALIALTRPLYRAGMEGDWWDVKLLNLAILLGAWFALLWCVREILSEIRGPDAGWDGWLSLAAFCAFVTTQMGVDSLPHTTPDKLVALFFFVSCALLLRLLRTPGYLVSTGLGAVLGLGFIAKSIFEIVGAAALLVAAAMLWREGRRLRVLVPGAVMFMVILAGYGTMLSRAVGHRTLGESGSINYAWHVNRLHKWVHWEGGADSAEEAWMSARVARFAHWDDNPPDFGAPIRHDLVAIPAPGSNATVRMYVFHAPFHGSYVPYLNPTYWYQGYRHFLRWRYQAIAISKNIERLLIAILLEPWFCAAGALLALCVFRRTGRAALLRPRRAWAVIAVATITIAIYLPVHLEGRYVSAFLAVLTVVAMILIAPATAMSRSKYQVAVAFLVVGFLLGLVKDQRLAWSRVLHGQTHQKNLHWRMGEAMTRAGLPPGSQIGVIFWGANLDSDWASMAQVEITSEIATGSDEDAFWALPASGQRQVLERFRQAGAVAVVSRDAPRNAAVEWQQPDDAPLWIHRF